MDTTEKTYGGFGKKTVGKTGPIADIVGKQPLPKVFRVKQKFDTFAVRDIEAEVKRKLARTGTLDRIRPGQRIAMTAGSRGIANIVKILSTVGREVKRAGGSPFIVPAMGSHGGATAEGQADILRSYGITEDSTGCPIVSSMETVQVGVSEYGKPVRIDRNAAEADGIIVIGRVKPHTAFTGSIESGLFKMITIGLGKQYGAEICHSDSFKDMERNVTSIAREVLKTGKVLFGLAIVENAFDETRKIEAIPADRFFEEEPALLVEAKEYMPAILFEETDVLIVDEIGKNISGSGMDPNVTGTFATPYAQGGIRKQRTVVLDVTDASHGNTTGLGMADFSVKRAYDKMDFEMTYPNSLTSTVIGPGKTPIILANDKMAVQAAIQTCNKIDYRNPRIVRIKNTLSLGEIILSEAFLPSAKSNPRIEVLEEPRDFGFDAEGNLF